VNPEVGAVVLKDINLKLKPLVRGRDLKDEVLIAGSAKQNI
jgi:hypothetical protein